MYAGLYLSFVYIAHIRRNGCGAFVQYKARNVIIFKDNNSGGQLYFKVLSHFKQKLMQEQHLFTIVATCMRIVSQMDDVFEQYAVFDFITIECNILATLEW